MLQPNLEPAWGHAFENVLARCGHFDLPLRHCAVELDGAAVVREGLVLA